MLLLQQMIALFIFMMIGYGVRKKNIIDDAGAKSISWLIVNVANPALILSGSALSDQTLSLQDFGYTLFVASVLFFGLIILSFPLTALMHVPASQKGIYKMMTAFSNIGFMGFPLIRAMYGNDALIYASLFIIPFNILIYTYGILTLDSAANGHHLHLKQALNPGTIACALSVVIAILQPTLPDFLTTVIEDLSDLTASLSMMVIGMSLATIALTELFVERKLWIFSLIKLIPLPMLVLWITKLFIQDNVLLGICFVMLCAPAASMIPMLAQQYDSDYKLASKGVALSTLLSVVTMPLVSTLMGIS